MMDLALKKRNNRSLLQIKIFVSFLEKLLKKNSRFILTLLWCCLLYHGVCGVAADEVSVKEGDSVTFQTRVKANQQDRIRWYFNSTRIAEISGDLSKICTDVQCNEGTERFRDRLKLDHQTGSLTIMNTRTTDSGDFRRKIINTGSVSDKIFNVSVHGVSAAERDQMKRKSVKEGESITLDPGVVKNPNVVKMWYFNDIPIAEITGDQSKVCTDDECKERFRDRLKLNHQTGSLTIMNTRTTDSGDYKLEITSSSFSISRILTVLTVIDSGLSPAAVAGIVTVVVLLIAAAAAVFLYLKARRKIEYYIQHWIHTEQS